ncbi:MAG: hypothetical protein NTV63_02140 [Candidatus Woesearchaeota archaeon]|nr:hypothetical protein [Candidatus Woesearchaeota archaeon]
MSENPDFQRNYERAMLKFIGSLGSKKPGRIFHERISSASGKDEDGELIVLGNDIFLSKKSSFVLSEKFNLDALSYCGSRRGSIRKGNFIPGPNFLNDLIPFIDELNYVVVNDKSEWLFLCGRDVFRNGIIKKSILSYGNALVLNSRRECLGYGKIEEKGSLFLRNVFDIGDFLRRERKNSEK